MFEAVALVLWLFLFLGIWYAYGNICIAPIFLETTAKVIMAAVYRTGTAFAGYEIMAMFGFDFITADIAANSEYSDASEPGVRRVRATVPAPQSQCSGQ